MNYQKLCSSLIVALIAANVGFADEYAIDPAHSSVMFSVRHLVISNVKGGFNKFTGTLTHDPKATPAITQVSTAIETASINTGIEKRDAHLRTPDFFDVEKHPQITFESKKIEKSGDNYTAHGTLTIHGVSKEIALSFVANGPIKDMAGKDRLGIEATTTINRKDYGLTWNKALESGGLVVGDEVKIDIQAEYVKQ